jgi:uncharacterized protein YigA (DUF484 family)
VTEALSPDEVARFLAANPDFFDLHPEALAHVAIPHPHDGQAVSLVERQSQILRDKVRTLELRLAEMLRHGQENDAIADRIVHWARALLSATDPAELPRAALDELLRQFDVPYGALRVWGVAPAYAALECAQSVSDDIVRLAGSMQAPFCGSNVGFEAAGWMADDPAAIRSLAMIPLRVGGDSRAFGLLALGSPDPDRFHITMGTAFLARIGELASAALARLRA